ncbi:hypothetical protein GUITHDRAFT_158205 [Guillardia theta CCMP2712]|uniref:tRNA-dihydrouridine(16/17) synthase [NAD(P)(+)] n=1 Tax=Guillardia theta (strain CCMP2712) TaxID=905079 RepID=L1IZV4_GUITC|nr:hypothetical protein GUITHDRAFT_158205 [Guillardia theta CCMP2712]EKX41444.1 hypothetical protein GUITHDRAFT_158205 [Guillardia theta CCMP2712]|eukprot:XP_005828424.1 hypothetical protein GUITHDRAFT_158205 [Guillardia theta CCMP2712]
MEDHVQAAWKHWEKLGNPRWIMAPMVDQSELAFRMMGRKYNCDLCYTPMLHSRMFVNNAHYRKDYLQSFEKDRPLIVQFCANNPNTLLQAAKYVEDSCDAVDLNLGCPQEIARRGRYGSFLMEDWDRIHDLVLTMKQSLKVPIWAKIRLFPEISQTIEYAKMIEAAGASAIAIHGRTRKQKGNNPGPANLDSIREVAKHLRVPVIANGNIRTFEEAQECLRKTECHAVMSACGLLVTPNLFSGT